MVKNETNFEFKNEEGEIRKGSTVRDKTFVLPEIIDPILKKNELLTEEDKALVKLNKNYYLRDKEQDYTQAVILYDSIPKFYHGILPRDEQGRLQISYRSFKFKIRDKLAYNYKETYEIRVNVQPVLLEINYRGVNCFKDFWPGTFEEIVEEIIKRLAVEQAGHPKINTKNGNLELIVEFTIYEIMKILEKDYGRKANYTEVKNSIKLLRDTTYELENVPTTERGKTRTVTYRVFQNVIFTNKSDSRKTKCHVVLHDDVTKAILEGKVRLLNYKTVMSLESPLSRWIYRRLAMNYTYAKKFAGQPFNILMSTIYKESGVPLYSQTSKNINRLKKAIQELKEKNVIHACIETYIDDGKRKNTVVDMKLDITGTIQFASEMINFNKRSSEVGPDFTTD